MNAISYGRVGNKDKKAKTIWGTVIVFIVVLIVGVFTPSSYDAIFTGFHVGTIVYFYNDQKKLYGIYRSNGGVEKAGIGMPILLSILGLIALFILVVFLLVVFDASM